MRIEHANVRAAVDEDLYPIVHFAMLCNADSDYNLPFDIDNALAYTWQFIKGEGHTIVVAEREGKIIGAVLMAKSLEYHEKPFCYMCKFWVLREGKGTDASRQLMSATVQWAKAQGCTHLFSTATAGLDHKSQQLFINLSKKAGLAEAGPVLSLKVEAAV